MGSKLATILSMLFFVLSMMFSADLININITYNSLNAFASNLSTYFAKHGGTAVVGDAFSMVSNEFNGKVQLKILKNGVTKVGDMLPFSLTKKYESILANGKIINISVKRSSYIGAYTS